MIEQYVNWNEDIGEWQLKCVAYTGNNMRKQTPSTDDKTKVWLYCIVFIHFYSASHSMSLLEVLPTKALILCRSWHAEALQLGLLTVPDNEPLPGY